MLNREFGLNGVRILVTRPRPQAEGLCRLIERQGGIALNFPTLEIKPLAQTDEIKAKLQALNDYHWLIFISANAVNFALKANNGKIEQFAEPRIAAVGGATAKALKDHDLSVDLLPDQGFNSEALLQTSAMRAIAGQRCLIVRGRGGREMLADTLRQRGASVDYLEVYQRTMPNRDISELLALLQHNRLNAVTITSGEALQNLLAMLGDDAPLLFSLPLVVISDRIEQMARQIGFKRILVTNSPADTAILQTLTTLPWGKQWPK
ncbi:uroporphyrinogen-III synthase [Methylomarinum sp. Ch1-1]|uniref:Uroporphyrinogen-III synthase n=1 Tax=Methylomarinum roseum TaxID=3067653 RepID=A0AAU7NY55_9GAMM|nr:uroporphyrinogen-III synthase [Methylomarinum sp. Ch1-1]MDP4521991.1 uroporphyrinogen-III synthase [Methylomarinum sp. Ch1-1]